MKAAAIIAEYNPFHNGHMYHLNESRKKSGADALICVMSGDFVQRGEPALISKWDRAKAALLSGINLVFELPVIYSTASAETFAKGAIRIIEKLGVAGWLCFGTEAQNLESLLSLAMILQNESSEFKKQLRGFLKEGHSFPKSRQLAIGKLFPEYEQFLTGSNNVLAIEYLKALGAYKSIIKPLSIKRIGSDYKSEEVQGEYSSATAIRNLILTSKDFSSLVPAHSKDIIDSCTALSLNPFSDTILYLLRRIDISSLSKVDYMNDGLSQILYNNAFSVSSTQELIESSLSKRHTTTRLKRALLSLLLDISSKNRNTASAEAQVAYTRVLAFDDTGRALLSEIKKKGDIKIITKAANYKRILDKNSQIDFERDLLASDIYSTFSSKIFVPDITRSPVRPQ